MAATFKERTSDRPPSGRFAVDQADYNRTYVLYEQFPDGSDHPVTLSEITNQIIELIGGTNPGPSPRPLGSPGGAGSLDRLMPTADGQWAGMFADSVVVQIDAMEGYVQDQNGLAALLAVPPRNGFARYNGVHYVVAYVPRPFAVLPNERMTMKTNTYYEYDGTQKLLKYYPEWLRYTQTLVDDVDSRVSASVGSALEFRVPSGSPAGIDGSMFNAIPDMVIPDQSVRVRWYQVPLRYLTSPRSHLVRWKGRINAWEWMERPVGSLLYLGARTIKTYTPPQFEYKQQAGSIDGFLGILQGSYFAEPLVDLELSFTYTARTRPDADAIPAEERPNGNWLDAPMNWQPCFATKRFHYAHAKANVTTLGVSVPDYARWVPTYLSGPIPHVLFQDPDVTLIVDL